MISGLKLLQKQKTLVITIDNDQEYHVSCRYLREHSPSAANNGQCGDVNIIGIDPVGNYAVKLIFDDGHDSGIYSWELLQQLAKNFA